MDGKILFQSFWRIYIYNPSNEKLTSIQACKGFSGLYLSNKRAFVQDVSIGLFELINFEKKITFENPYKVKPNVVFVMLESVGTATMSFYGNPLNSTPKMDSIIKESLSFSKFYVHKPGTAASVFASITGLPDIEDVKTASRNPMIIDQRIIFDQFKGYEKSYFLGCSANWANIRGVFQANIKELKIYSIKLG